MMEVIEVMVKGIFKVIWKTFLIALWGSCKLLETIFHAINDLLRDAVKK